MILQLFLQVGSGVAGLAAALTLLQNGLSVRIIDKAITPKVGCKAMGVQVRAALWIRDAD